MIYYISNKSDDIKIGFTKANVNKRLRQLQTGSSEQLYLIASHDGDMGVEKALHDRFVKDRVRMNNEWFHVEEDGELHNYLNTISRHYVDVSNGEINLYMKIKK